ncbi:response regulator [Virgibacillus sp. 179-BFC.A HS]|uniref:Response regulator n=1 Tax=Tigheibacillus jepli TaxID=3035914 RepID=A0ABU5CEX8_9BACI|nr:response regulator [Virgibacillus sp. 179-BFC.A HS]MDY0404887.1 response regulator [Virgibacillus sp. 179-BFC.A HS]
MPENISVMIIEDDFRISAIHRQIVEKIAGFTVVKEAKTAKEAMAYLQGIPQAPDLILLDVYIPDVAGLDLFWQLRMQYRLTSLIVITAAQEMETVRAAIVGGVFDYMTKPLDANRLEQSLLSFQEKHAFLTARKNCSSRKSTISLAHSFLRNQRMEQETICQKVSTRSH